MTSQPPLLFCMLQIHFFDQTRNFGSLDISSVWDVLISTINTIVSASGSSALGGGGSWKLTHPSLGWSSLNMPSISARAKWWCQCAFLVEDPKFRVYVQKWRMRVYNEGYYWHISFKCQNHALFPYYHAHLSVVWFLLSFHCFWRYILKFIYPQGLPFTHSFFRLQNAKKTLILCI